MKEIVKYALVKATCSGCGKKGKVLILLGKILSRKWFYFGTISMKNGSADYWECERCYKK